MDQVSFLQMAADISQVPGYLSVNNIGWPRLSSVDIRADKGPDHLGQEGHLLLSRSSGNIHLV